MINLITDKNLVLSDDMESRRLNERYQCHDLKASYNPFLSRALNKTHTDSKSAIVKDISISGLSIEINDSVAIGDLLFIQIPNPADMSSEDIAAEIMWVKISGNSQYTVGLKVITEDDISFGDNANLFAPADATPVQKKLVCSNCNEVSFFINRISDHEKFTNEYNCCHCGHGHYITQVIAFNRKLTEAA